MTEPLEPIGPFPPQLYRIFSEEQWARALVEEGRLRFRPVQYFASLEDVLRADASEGQGHLQVKGEVTRIHIGPAGTLARTSSEPGYINFRNEFINPVFIYCFSYPPNNDLALLPKKFGRFVVRIDDPRQLAVDVTEKLTEDAVLRGTPIVECHRVSYDKGARVDTEPDHWNRTRLSFTQKPASFADEYEYRFASVDCRGVGNRELSSEVYDVVIGRPLPYASLFTI